MQVEADKIICTDEVALELEQRIAFESIEVVVVIPKCWLEGNDQILARSDGGPSGCRSMRSPW